MSSTTSNLHKTKSWSNSTTLCTSYNSVQVIKESFIGSDVVGVVRFDEVKNEVDDVLDWSSESIGEHASRSNHQQQHSEHRHNDALKQHKSKEV